MNKIILTKAKTQDANIVATIHVQGWRDGYSDLIPHTFLDTMNIPERTERWRTHLSEGSNIWIAYYNGAPSAIIGFGKPINPVPVTLDQTNTAEITLLYTLRKFYCNGIGTRLFQHAHHSLKQDGYKKVFLWVLKDNKAGCNFYNKMNGKIITTDLRSTSIGNQEFQEISYWWDL